MPQFRPTPRRSPRDPQHRAIGQRPRNRLLTRRTRVSAKIFYMSTVVQAAGHRIEIEDNQVLVDGEVRPVSPAGMAALRVLAHRPGHVVARDILLRALPGRGNSMHAVESAVLRLRTALGDSQIVATVVKRGYRLAVDSEQGVA